MNSQAIVIIAPTGTLTDLYTVYFNAIDAVTVNSLDRFVSIIIIVIIIIVIIINQF